MSDLHIDDFLRDAAIVLNRLYLSFPRPLTLFVEDIIGRDEPDEFGMHSVRHDACFAAMQWLAHEGHLRFSDTIRREAIDQAVLSGRMFTLLSTADPNNEVLFDETVPEALRLEYASNVHRLREALQSQSSTRVRATMTDLLRRATGV